MAATANVHVDWAPTERGQPKHHVLDMSRAHAPPVVGDVVGQRGTVVCLAHASLADAVDLLVVHDRTAAGIVDDEGSLQGVLTENDMIIAYGSGAPATAAVRSWLKSGVARLPAPQLPELTVRPSTTLADAVGRMREHINSDSACHHLVVLDDDGRFHGVLSSLDLARAVCALQKLRGTTVSEVMKPLADVPRCDQRTPLGDVIRKMADTHQNCVLIGQEDDEVLGIVTPRDALLAFGEHVPLDVSVAHWLSPLDATVGHWVRGLQLRWESRQVSADALVADAAAAMAAGSMHHLVVVSPLSSNIVGVVSTLDLARALAADADMVVLDGP